MKATLRKLWESRSPRDRIVVAMLCGLVGIALYAWLVSSVGRAHERLRSSVPALRAQAALLENQAAEFGRLRALPPVPASKTDLRTLVQTHAGTAGLSGALTRIDAADANQAVVVFGSVGFADWRSWVESLKAQQVRVESCRIEALSTPGMVSVTATLIRSKTQ